MGIRPLDPYLQQLRGGSAGERFLQAAALAPRFDFTPRPMRSEPRLCEHEAFEQVKDQQFGELSRATRAHGGLVTGDDVARRMGRHCNQPISALARLIVARRVLSLEWRSQLMLPMFQFNESDMSLRAPVHAALDELRCVFDDWELAMWFTQPNCWLQERRPVDLVVSDGEAVAHAARADRFVARG